MASLDPGWITELVRSFPIISTFLLGGYVLILIADMKFMEKVVVLIFFLVPLAYSGIFFFSAGILISIFYFVHEKTELIG